MRRNNQVRSLKKNITSQVRSDEEDKEDNDDNNNEEVKDSNNIEEKTNRSKELTNGEDGVEVNEKDIDRFLNSAKDKVNKELIIDKSTSKTKNPNSQVTDLTSEKNEPTSRKVDKES